MLAPIAVAHKHLADYASLVGRRWHRFMMPP